MTMVVPLGWQVLDANGNPYAGAKAYTYLTGTSTPQATYSDSGLTTPHANPVVADAAGRFPAIYGPTTNDYKLVLKTSADVTIETYDPVQMTGTPGAGTIGTAQLDGDAVTNAKLANMAANRVKGRATTGTGDPEDLTITQVLDMTGGTARGALPMRGASSWGALTAGTAGYGLVAGGAGADFAWANNAVRAHCAFTGTGTPAFRGTPYNVASITDNGAGDYTLNFTVALPSVNYTPLPGCSVVSGASATFCNFADPLTTSCRVLAVQMTSGSSTLAGGDPGIVSFAAFGG